MEARERNPSNTTELLVKPRPRYFAIGERIETPLTRFAPDVSDFAIFTILEKKGEGYAGQVYKAVDETTGELYALKALRPESELKENARDFFFRLSFSGNFTPAIDESALRYGMLWQIVLRRGAKVALGDERIIPEPKGYFWNDKLQTFVEVHEWVEGHIPPPTDPEKNRKKRQFMDDIVTLAEDMGAYQLTRQYKWWTMLAGTNVVERDADGTQVAID